MLWAIGVLFFFFTWFMQPEVAENLFLLVRGASPVKDSADTSTGAT